jgi:hypothetical protein
MLENDSPYRSPPNAAYARPRASSASWRVVLLVALPILGAIFGFIFSITAGFASESARELNVPRLSYGQAWGLFTLPLCTLTGAAIGLGFSLALSRQFVWSVSLLVAVSLGCFEINRQLWNDQIASYGPDPSEAVLYHPPQTLAILAFISALLVILVATWPGSRKAGTRVTDA